MQSTNTSKGSSVSLDENGLYRYKGFDLVETPAQYFAEGTQAIFSPDKIVLPFVGISTTRTIESVDFDGVQLQGAAKGGRYTLTTTRKLLSKLLT